MRAELDIVEDDDVDESSHMGDWENRKMRLTR